ncbi:MAG: hypothetical protein AB7O21_02220 [Gammaproteobacteria bacterium]
MSQAPSTPANHGLRLRQVALVAPVLAPLEHQASEIFGLTPCHRDPSVGAFGLVNVLFAVGSQFLEIVAPTRPDTAGGRQLARHGGPGGYMVITQCRRHAPYRARAEAAQVRVVHAFERPEFVHMQLHPQDTGGTFLEIDEQRGPGADLPDGDWYPAGRHWRDTPPSRLAAIVAAEIACADPVDVARRWGSLTGCTPRDAGAGHTLALADAELRFVPQTPGMPDRLRGIEVIAREHAAIRAAAAVHGLARDGDTLTFAGLRIRLT